MRSAEQRSLRAAGRAPSGGRTRRWQTRDRTRVVAESFLRPRECGSTWPVSEASLDRRLGASLRRWQDREVFDRLDIHLPRDTGGFLGYVLAYEILISAAAIRGYAQYALGAGRRWK
jgi:hypothetical protein